MRATYTVHKHHVNGLMEAIYLPRAQFSQEHLLN